MDLFKQALHFVFGNEGGYSNHPDDHGGATNFGVTQKTLDQWNDTYPELEYPLGVENLSQDQAETIYRTNYWKWDGVSDPAIAIKLFDIGVNAGVYTAVRLLQRALCAVDKPVAVDGHLGPRTLAATNTSDPGALLGQICTQHGAYYYAICARDQRQTVFLKGWLKRAALKPEVT
jgi:lysozyme family protein